MNAVSRGGWYRYQAMCAAIHASQSERDGGEPDDDARVQRPRCGAGLAASSSAPLIGLARGAHSLRSSSPFVNIHVRVMCRTSVSRLMSGGNAANGADISTILTAAASSTRWPEERLISTLSTLPSLLIDTVSSRLP